MHHAPKRPGMDNTVTISLKWIALDYAFCWFIF